MALDTGEGSTHARSGPSLTGVAALLSPRSVAVVGASPDLNSAGGRPVRYLKQYGFAGEIFPVNPKYREVAGLPCYPSVGDIPGEVDLAVISVAAGRCRDVVRDCVAKGVKAALMFAAGFAETGEEGRRREAELVALAREGGLRICGPNSIGVTNLAARMAATFSPALDEECYLRLGSAALISQSGALGYGFYTMCQDAGLGFRYVVSTGNEADLSCLDFMDYVLDDPEVRVVLAYLETIRDPARFEDVAAKARSRGKPIVALKVGRSEVGGRAALSHTAALAGSDEAYGAAFRREGVIRASDLDHLLDLGVAFDCLLRGRSGLPRGRRVVVVATSGGAGILMADKCQEWGLELASLDADVRDRLAQVVPTYGSTVNPVDVTGQVVNEPELARQCLEVVAGAAGVDVVVFMLGTLSRDLAVRVVQGVAGAAASVGRPLIVVWSGGRELSREGRALLLQEGVPCFNVPGRAARALADLAWYTGARDATREPRRRTLPAPREGAAGLLAGQVDGTLTWAAGERLLSVYDIPLAPGALVGSPEEAAAAWRGLGCKVAVKLCSPDIRHRTEVGAVRLGLSSEDEVRAACRAVTDSALGSCPGARVEGVLVQTMVDGVQELLIGARRDPQFGPLVTAALGGVWVEVFRDISMRLAPLDLEEALAMLSELKASALLRGARGRKPADLEAVARILVNLGRMMVELPDLM
ncbi:MAG: acetate--CoA ligase family protein, partial [Acetobacteraceae bacterium]|nr:acetate--CoA ligase family protein [Acetobacteraceae bacterium]